MCIHEDDRRHNTCTQAFLKNIVSLTRNHDPRIQLCATTIIASLAAAQTSATAILDAGMYGRHSTVVMVTLLWHSHVQFHRFIMSAHDRPTNAQTQESMCTSADQPTQTHAGALAALVPLAVNPHAPIQAQACRALRNLIGGRDQWLKRLRMMCASAGTHAISTTWLLYMCKACSKNVQRMFKEYSVAVSKSGLAMCAGMRACCS